MRRETSTPRGRDVQEVRLGVAVADGSPNSPVSDRNLGILISLKENFKFVIQ